MPATYQPPWPSDTAFDPGRSGARIGSPLSRVENLLKTLGVFAETRAACRHGMTAPPEAAAPQQRTPASTTGRIVFVTTGRRYARSVTGS
jgi:hypothetical protein